MWMRLQPVSGRPTRWQAVMIAVRFRSGLLLLCCLLMAPVARGDYIPPPVHSVHLSANGQTRVHVWPRDVKMPAVYAKFLTDGHANATTATAVVERMDKTGRWQVAWAVRLRNNLAPRHVLVTNDGRHLVTADDWYISGNGDRALVIYDDQGAMRGHRLSDFLPLWYREVLPTQWESRHWQSGLSMEPDEGSVGIDLLIPGGLSLNPNLPSPDLRDWDQGTVRIYARLADGAILMPDPETWANVTRKVSDAAIVRAGEIAGEIVRVNTDLTRQPNDHWQLYGLELAWRVTDAYRFASVPTVTYAPEDPEDFCTALARRTETEPREEERYLMITSRGRDNEMLSALNRCELAPETRAALNNRQIYFAIHPMDDAPFLAALAAKGVSRANGAAIDFVDASYPIQQRPDRLITREQILEHYGEPPEPLARMFGKPDD